MATVVPSGKSFEDATDEVNLPYSFGAEIELILVPKDAKFKQLFTLAEHQDLKDLYEEWTKLLPNYKTKPGQDEEQLRVIWAKFIALHLQKLMIAAKDTSMPFLYAKDKSAAKHKSDGTYYRHWTIIEDPAVAVNASEGEWSVEIVTPVQYAWHNDWYAKLDTLFSTISTWFTIKLVGQKSANHQIEQRGSTHVHVRWIPKNPGPGPTLEHQQVIDHNLKYGTIMSNFVSFWDPCLHVMAPKVRRERRWARSNDYASENLYLNLQELDSKKAAFNDLFAMIDKGTFKMVKWENSYDEQALKARVKSPPATPQDVEILWEFMQGGYEKYVAWRFSYLKCGKFDKMSGTVEHRRPPGSATKDAVAQSVALTLCFAHGARTHNGTGTGVFAKMCAEKVDMKLNKPYKDFKNSEPMPDGMLEFGNSKLSDFKTWMLQAAADFDKVDTSRTLYKDGTELLFVNQYAEDQKQGGKVTAWSTPT